MIRHFATGGLALALALVLGLAGCVGAGGPFRDRADLVAEPAACAPQRFDVYFDDGQARLTAPARQMIGLAAAQVGGCEVRHVRVLGLADASGRPAANLTLSERRAQAVAEALAAAGLPAPAFEVEAGGDVGAVTADGAAEPLRRRTEVVIEARPR